MTEFDIVCAGISCLDFLVSGNVTSQVFEADSTAVESIMVQSGGDAANQAITAASLGMKTALLSCVGRDWKGAHLISIFNEWGINTDFIRKCDDAASVSAIVLIGDDGQRNFLFDRGCGRTYSPGKSDLEAIRSTRILSIGSFFVMPEFDARGARLLLKEAVKNNVITVADMTCDTLGLGFDVLDDLLPLIDFLMPSIEEAVDLTGERDLSRICRVFKDKGAKNIIIKMGAEGCYLNAGSLEKIIPACSDVNVVDTTGCGDNFVAAFCYGLLHEYSVEDCVGFACAAAAINAGYIGACGHLESADKVHGYLRNK